MEQVLKPVEEAARIALEHSVKSYNDRLDAMQAKWAELWDGGQRNSRMLARQMNLVAWRKSVNSMVACTCSGSCWAENQDALQVVFAELEQGYLVVLLPGGDLLKLQGVSV